jgi:hypothetical protein
MLCYPVGQPRHRIPNQRCRLAIQCRERRRYGPTPKNACSIHLRERCVRQPRCQDAQPFELGPRSRLGSARRAECPNLNGCLGVFVARGIDGKSAEFGSERPHLIARTLRLNFVAQIPHGGAQRSGRNMKKEGCLHARWLIPQEQHASHGRSGAQDGNSGMPLGHHA